MKILGLCAFLLMACGGNPLIGTWTGNDSTYQPGFTLSFTATFTDTALTEEVDVALGSTPDARIVSVTTHGTYSIDSKQTPNKINASITKADVADKDNNAIVVNEKNDPVTGKPSFCFVAPGQSTETCVPKSQSASFTVNGNKLSITLNASGADIPEVLTKK